MTEECKGLYAPIRERSELLNDYSPRNSACAPAKRVFGVTSCASHAITNYPRRNRQTVEDKRELKRYGVSIYFKLVFRRSQYERLFTMIKEKELPTLYERVGIGSKNYCVTCKKKEDGYDLLLEKKIKIRSRCKVADPSKSTTRKVVFSTNMRISDFDKINYDVLLSSLLYEEKKIFKNIINKISGEIDNG